MLPNWSGRTVICIASGPSLTADDCELARASGHPVIVTNTTFRACPWADALFGFDLAWWKHYIDEVRQVFKGRLYSKSPGTRQLGVTWADQDLRFVSLGNSGFGNSGTCAVSLAMAAQAKDVIMLGYDCQLTEGRSHHHGDHPSGINNCDTLKRWPVQFARLAAHARNRKVRVVNASRVTALTCFETLPLELALAAEARAVAA